MLCSSFFPAAAPAALAMCHYFEAMFLFFLAANTTRHASLFVRGCLREIVLKMSGIPCALFCLFFVVVAAYLFGVNFHTNYSLNNLKNTEHRT